MWVWRIGLIGWFGLWFASAQAEARCPVARRPVCRVGFSPNPREFSGSRPELSAVELPSSSLSCAASPFVCGGTFCFSCHLFAPHGQTCYRWSCPPPLRALSVYAVVILRSREQACSRQLRLSRPTVLAFKYADHCAVSVGEVNVGEFVSC